MTEYDAYQRAENALGEIDDYTAFLVDHDGDGELIEALGHVMELIEREKKRAAPVPDPRIHTLYTEYGRFHVIEADEPEFLPESMAGTQTADKEGKQE